MGLALLGLGSTRTHDAYLLMGTHTRIPAKNPLSTTFHFFPAIISSSTSILLREEDHSSLSRVRIFLLPPLSPHLPPEQMFKWIERLPILLGDSIKDDKRTSAASLTSWNSPRSGDSRWNSPRAISQNCRDAWCLPNRR